MTTTKNLISLRGYMQPLHIKDVSFINFSGIKGWIPGYYWMSWCLNWEVNMDMKRDLNTKDAYFSYLLRIWRLENDAGSLSTKESIWRVSLECTRSRTRVTFTSLEDLLYFLQDQLKLKDQTSCKSKNRLLWERAYQSLKHFKANIKALIMLIAFQWKSPWMFSVLRRHHPGI